MSRTTSICCAIGVCCGLAAAGCSEHRSAPTGLAVGLGLGAEAQMPRPYEAYPVAAASQTKSTGKPDVFGTLSVENFQGTQNNLNHTHESADGFSAFLAGWHAPNFVYRDGDVGTWQFHDVAGGDNWDLWSSGGVDYGIDAVMAAFHSSHGGMSANGVYSTSLGQNWSGRGWSARSDKMALGADAGAFGDERLRYMFWDTCQALRERGGKDTAQLWRPSARGIRMIFGYRDNTVDSPHYGEYFWQEWNKEKSFTLAFLDASWRINQGQSPAVLAFGPTQDEALSRRDTERMLYWDPVQSAWGAWSWYSNKTAVADKSASSVGSIPYEVRLQEVKRRANDTAGVVAIAADLGITVADERMIQRRPYGLTAVETDRGTLVVEPDGDFELRLRQTTDRAPKGRAMDDAGYEARARQLVEQFDLTKGEPYELAAIRYTMEQAADPSGAAGEPRVAETTVVFSQVVDGLPFIDPEAGLLELTFDCDSQSIVRMRSAWRQLTPEYEKQAAVVNPRSVDDLRLIALRRFQQPPQPDGSGKASRPGGLQVVPDSERVGYYDLDGVAVPVYRVLLFDPRYPDSKYHEAVVPLAAS